MKTLLALALVLTTMVGSVPTATAADATVNDIVSALKARGITTYLDADRCHQYPIHGFYVGQARALILCTNGSRETTPEIADTLRHEAWHYIQDCKNNSSVDGNLQLVFAPDDHDRVIEALAKAGISAERIRQVYSANGQADHVPYEYEAFLAGAGSNQRVIDAMNTFCPIP